MSALRYTIILAIVFVTFATAQLKPKDFPRIAGATLLSGYPSAELALTTSKGTILLGHDLDGPATPSITSDGQFIAATRAWEGESAAIHHFSTVVLYDVKTRTSREITGRLSDVVCVSISPDQTKIAYLQQNRAASQGTSRIPVLHIIEARTGFELLRKTLGTAMILSLSWSPGADELVFDQVEFVPDKANPPNSNSEIFILEVGTGSFKKVAEGAFPSWSPSGEWIAYLDRTHPFAYANQFPANQIMLVHPDGSSPHPLMEVGTRRFVPWFWVSDQRRFWFAPVWSPDSGQLLANEYVDWDKFTFDVHLVEVATGHTTRISRDKAPVYGWAQPK